MNPAALITPGLQIIRGIVDDVHTSKEEKAAALLLAQKLEAEPHLGQIEVNKIEAGHASMFVAGWRPAVGWVCALALLYAFVLRELILWCMLIYGYEGPEPPKIIQLPEIITITLAMLGLGGVRTVEKLSGVARERISKPTPETFQGGQK